MEQDKRILISPELSASFSGMYDSDTQEVTAESSVDMCLNKISVFKETDTRTEEDERSCDLLMKHLNIYWGPKIFNQDEREKRELLHIKLKIQEKNASRRVQISGEFLQDLFNVCNGQIFPYLEIVAMNKVMVGAPIPNMEIKFSGESAHGNGDFKSRTYWENFGRIGNRDNYVPFVSAIKENRPQPATVFLVIHYKLSVLDKFLPESQPGLFGKMLTDKFHTDVEIVALDGGIVPCHKGILAAASPVLASLLRSPMVETKTNQINFDMEESSVAAFLEFLYMSEIHKPAQDSRIAFDLLEAGHKYDIPGMEKCMKAILLSRPAHWFEVDAALKMFMFARNLESYEQVTAKAVEVMKFYRGKLGSSEEFKDILKRSPEASAVAIAELINAMLDASPCKCEKPQE